MEAPALIGPDTVEEAAERWVSWIEAARAQSASLPAYLEVRYEDLVIQTEATLKKVCDFIGLRWEAGMLDYHLAAGERLGEMAHPLGLSGGRVIQAAERKAIHTLAAQPPRPDRIGVWKSEMRPEERSRFERVAGRLLRDLGYEVPSRESLSK